MTTLADWLASDHDLAERLELIDNLCRALDEFHAREPRARPALDPNSVGLTPELGVTLHASDPRDSAEQVPEYRAPETVAGAPYDPAVDSYSVGVLCYEILSGRHPFVLATPLGDIEAAADVPPPPLAGVRPDVPRDLAEAIMPCLERDPEWRPKDLSYLVETLRKARRSVPAAPRRRVAAKPPAAKPPAVKAPAAKPAAVEARQEAPLGVRPAPPSSSRLPFVAAAVVGLAAVLGGLWYLTLPQQAPAPTTPSRSAASAPGASVPPGDAGTTPGGDTAPAKPEIDHTTDAPRPVPTAVPSPGAPAATPAPRVDGAAPPPQSALTPPPAASSAPPPATAMATPTPRESARVAVATPLPTPPPPRSEAARPEPAEPARPAVVSTLVPARLRRGATILVDVRGSDLRADLQPRILFKGRETAAGVQPVGQQLVNPTWLKVMLRIDTQAREGSYTLTLGDAQGNVSNARTFEIGR